MSVCPWRALYVWSARRFVYPTRTAPESKVMKVRQIRSAIENMEDDADVVLDIDDEKATGIGLADFEIELTGVACVAGTLIISAEVEEDEDANGDDDDDMDDDDDDDLDDEDDEDELDEDDLDAEIEAQRKESLGLN